MDYLLVDEHNSILHRTQEYSCEKKWYKYTAKRPQKAALKAYNGIACHNTNFKKEKNNYIYKDFCNEKEININIDLEKKKRFTVG